MVGRKKGTRGPNYEQKRRELLVKIRNLCLADPHLRLSVREMARGAGVSVPTLMNYFADRDAICVAVLEQSWNDAQVHFDQALKMERNVRLQVDRELSLFFLAVRQFGLDKLMAWGLNEGLFSHDAGIAYLQYFLEPTLQTAETWLRHFQVEGSIPANIDVRFAALALYSPCVLFVLHQSFLGGSVHRPAELPQFIREHSAGFCRYVGAN